MERGSPARERVLEYGNVQASEAWKQRVLSEDRAVINQIRKKLAERSPESKLSSYQKGILPHISYSSSSNMFQSPVERREKKDTANSPSRPSTQLSGRSDVSRNSNRSSFSRTSTNSSKYYALLDKIKELEESVKMEKQSRMEVQEELDMLKNLLKKVKGEDEAVARQQHNE